MATIPTDPAQRKALAAQLRAQLQVLERGTKTKGPMKHGSPEYKDWLANRRDKEDAEAAAAQAKAEAEEAAAQAAAEKAQAPATK